MIFYTIYYIEKDEKKKEEKPAEEDADMAMGDLFGWYQKDILQFILLLYLKLFKFIFYSLFLIHYILAIHIFKEKKLY